MVDREAFGEDTQPMLRALPYLAVVAAFVGILLILGRTSIERSLLFFPTHRPADHLLEPWIQDGRAIGFCRIAASPKNVWLLLHGNGGQASDREYAIPCFSAGDSVFILEYPGYGLRDGVPSVDSLNQAAKEAYLLLRGTYPHLPVCVAAESIGSGPACTLAALAAPPDKYVLVVPFDQLSLVARDRFPALVVSLLLSDDWDNCAALSQYKGPVDIFGAEGDTIIPVAHAKALAAAIPAAKFVLVPGGHNEWSHDGKVTIRNP